MSVNLTTEEYKTLVRERDEASRKVGSALKALGTARSNIAKKKATSKDERRLLNEVLDIVDAAMNKV
tara:strand:+ start:959 stop:1159 length:201 start_codon:yes stop_codon:yes gene_type:complete